MNDPYHTPAVTEAPAPLAPPGALSSDEKNWAMIGHLSALSGFVSGIGFIAGPLIVWQVKKDTMAFASAESKEAFNFNLSWCLWTIIAIVVCIPLCLVLVGFFLLIFVGFIPLIQGVLSVIGGLRASEGKPYRYPLTIRFV